MAKVAIVSTCLAALRALPEAFEKYPNGARWVGGPLALALICQTIVSVHNKRD